ncbi:MAG: U32 family peptidase [Ignavibacterium sp.]
MGKIIKYKKPELMAPAGDWTMLSTAIHNGADAIYFGIEKLNMRMKADNFLFDELPEVIKFCKENNVDSYLTLNSIVYDDEINELDIIISKAKELGINGIICWDFSVIEKCKEYGVPFCISTQASISNFKAAKFYEQLGAKRVVLARECSLEQIKNIKEKTNLEVEVFVHGAMCISISGRCFLSHEMFNRSANRGDCLQPCRREYEIYDRRKNTTFLLGNDYILSAKDLCSIEFIDKLIEANIDAFKIEGRKRSPEYVAKTISVYRNAIDSYFNNKLTNELKEQMLIELSQVYNRGLSTGFYFDKPDGKDFSSIEGNSATTRKEYIGKVLNYYKQSKVAYIKIESGSLLTNDKVYIMGKTTGVIELEIQKIICEENEKLNATKGDKITFPCDNLIRSGDKVYKIINH